MEYKFISHVHRCDFCEEWFECTSRRPDGYCDCEQGILAITSAPAASVAPSSGLGQVTSAQPLDLKHGKDAQVPMVDQDKDQGVVQNRLAFWCSSQCYDDDNGGYSTDEEEIFFYASDDGEPDYDLDTWYRATEESSPEMDLPDLEEEDYSSAYGDAPSGGK